MIDDGGGGLAFRFCNGEQLTRTCDVVGARAFGEQAVVADAVEAFWQHVDEEAAENLRSAMQKDFFDSIDPEGTSAPTVIPTLGPYNYRAGCRHSGQTF